LREPRPGPKRAPDQPEDRGEYAIPRFLVPDARPFDPVELVRETEKIVCRWTEEGLERKYTDFYATGVYGGIATGYTVGCCLRCIFCWVDLSRDFPERYGSFCSPREAFERLRGAAKRYGVKKLRISGAEPTLGKEHLLSLLEHVEQSEFLLFILETNGILFGADADYVRGLQPFKKVHVRVSLKAGTPEGFTRRTGADPRSFELPYRAIKHLLDHGISFHVAAMSDPRLMPKEEREQMVGKVREIDPRLARNIEHEICDPYETTTLRMKLAGVDVRAFFFKRKPIY